MPSDLAIRRSLVARSHRLSLSVFALAILAATTEGCRPAVNDVPPTTGLAESPEVEFDRVTRRLESALEDARASAGIGIWSKRECNYRLIPPSDDEDQYTAEVTIQTTTAALAPRPSRSKAQQGDPTTKPAGDDPLLPQSEKKRIVAASKQRKEEKFLLIYQDDQWTLATEPKQELDRLFFEYALKD